LPFVQGLTPGARPELVNVGGMRVGVLNCLEDTVERSGAEVADADVLVNITNDVWFGESAARWQHLMLARWRAIETRRELVRAVNTGVTCHVNALGELESTTPVDLPVAQLVRARRLNTTSLARTLVRVVPYACAALIAVALITRRVRKRAASTEAT
jgi:apolipoprotein N-acyltransferase